MAVTKLAGAGRLHGYTTCAIAQEGSTSSVADVEGYAICGLLIPTLDSANLTFTVCNTSDGTFQTVKDKDASAHQVAAATGNFALSSDDLTPLAGYRYIKIVADASQDSAERTFTFVLKV